MRRTMLSPIGGAVFSLTLIGAVGAALALPLPAAPDGVVTATAEVEQIHGCHRGIQRSVRDGFATYGWHFHTRACERRDTAPPGYASGAGTRGSYDNPRCRYVCRFTGPIKSCEQVCR